MGKFCHFALKIIYKWPNTNIAVEVVKSYGEKNVIVVSNTNDGIHYLDEIGVIGETKILRMYDGIIGKNEVIKCRTRMSDDFILSEILQKQDRERNIRSAYDVLLGEGGSSYVKIILLNAGMLLKESELCQTLEEGMELAYDSIYSFKAKTILEKYVQNFGSEG